MCICVFLRVGPFHWNQGHSHLSIPRSYILNWPWGGELVFHKQLVWRHWNIVELRYLHWTYVWLWPESYFFSVGDKKKSQMVQSREWGRVGEQNDFFIILQRVLHFVFCVWWCVFRLKICVKGNPSIDQSWSWPFRQSLGGQDRCMHSSVIHTTQIQLLTSQRKKTFENIVGKGENVGNQNFLLFPLCFLPFSKQILIFIIEYYIYFVVCKSFQFGFCCLAKRYSGHWMDVSAMKP